MLLFIRAVTKFIIDLYMRLKLFCANTYFSLNVSMKDIKNNKGYLYHYV